MTRLLAEQQVPGVTTFLLGTYVDEVGRRCARTSRTTLHVPARARDLERAHPYVVGYTCAQDVTYVKVGGVRDIFSLLWYAIRWVDLGGTYDTAKTRAEHPSP